MKKVVLMDIEGTTTNIDFVHSVLFPYSHEQMGDFISSYQHDTDIQAQLKEAASDLGLTTTHDPEAIATELRRWIAEDRKHPVLKYIQGKIWKSGYRKGAFKGHIYPDVLSAWQKWQNEGWILAIYSSGSVEAQKLLFQHSVHGDIRQFISHHFDTKVGPKRESASYARITEELDTDPEKILFLSDVPDELAAAKAAGLAVLHIRRQGTPEAPNYPSAANFSEVDL